VNDAPPRAQILSKTAVGERPGTEDFDGKPAAASCVIVRTSIWEVSAGLRLDPASR
jgi:hypothetical protein